MVGSAPVGHDGTAAWLKAIGDACNVSPAKIADAQCAACHGKDGKTPTDPSYPKIAGQYPDYLLKALNDYHKGLRRNPIMGTFAGALTRDDIQMLAAYFAQQPALTTPGR